jgi:hypothetical protein
MSIETSGPAFPGSYTGNNGMPVWSDGMTLRDYFAAKADVSQIKASSIADAEKLAGRALPKGDEVEAFKWQCEVVAAMRYAMADAMLVVRERGEA